MYHDHHIHPLGYAGLADSFLLLGSSPYDALPPREAIRLAMLATALTGPETEGAV